jgi:hypothetical protein
MPLLELDSIGWVGKGWEGWEGFWTTQKRGIPKKSLESFNTTMI